MKLRDVNDPAELFIFFIILPINLHNHNVQNFNQSKQIDRPIS
jgi:hypothetical protein